MDKTCLTCRHWQTTYKSSSGEIKPVPMLRHWMAACAHGESWRSLPYKTPACNKYQAISPAALQRREAKIAEIQNTPYR